jgi:hypothetical protein
MTNDDVPNDLATVEQPGDVRYRIPNEHRCTCGYNLRGLTLTARCPECGKRIDDTIRGSNRSLREIRGGGLSGPASGVFLIFLAHVLWLWTALSIPTWWGETWLHRWLVAIAGPNLPLGVVISATPRYAFNDCMTIVVCFALQLAGVWLLANVRAYPAQIAATAIAWVLQVAPRRFGRPDHRRPALLRGYGRRRRSLRSGHERVSRGGRRRVGRVLLAVRARAARAGRSRLRTHAHRPASARQPHHDCMYAVRPAQPIAGGSDAPGVQHRADGCGRLRTSDHGVHAEPRPRRGNETASQRRLNWLTSPRA